MMTDMMSSRLFIHEPIFTDQELQCRYDMGDVVFINRYKLPAQTSDVSDEALKRLCRWVAIIGSSRLFCFDYFTQIDTGFPLSSDETVFFEKLLFLGLGEFRVVNDIPLSTQTTLVPTAIEPNQAANDTPKATSLNPLLLNGGGKDGAVSALSLSSVNIPFTWMQRGNSKAQDNVTAAWGRERIVITRGTTNGTEDRKYDGHRPNSANIAFIALLSAALAGHDSVIASNEASANEGNYVKDGVSINHQHSKSLEFESDMRTLLARCNVPVGYFSILRPLHELQIAFLAAELSPAQLGSITSCNNGTKSATWCMDCAKCAFVVLIMTASSPAAAKDIWHEQAINAPGLVSHLEMLLDPEQPKPFECVGTLDECQVAARILVSRSDVELSPEIRELLSLYTSELDLNSDILEHPLISSLSEHLIPAAYQAVLPVFARSIDVWKQKTKAVLN